MSEQFPDLGWDNPRPQFGPELIEGTDFDNSYRTILFETEGLPTSGILQSSRRPRFFGQANILDNDPPPYGEFTRVTPSGFYTFDYERKARGDTCARIESIVEKLLEEPDVVTYRQANVLVRGWPYKLELYSQASVHTELLEDGIPARWIYVRDEASQEKAFSLELSELEHRGKYKGLLVMGYEGERLAEFLEANGKSSELDPMWHQINMAHSMALALKTGISVPARYTEDLSQFFNQNIGNGAVQTEKRFFRKTKTGARVVVVCRSYEGDAKKHLGKLHSRSPLITIRIATPNTGRAVVYEKNTEGVQEVTIEEADLVKEKAQYAKEENIVRDENGGAISSIVNQDDKAAIQAAERAAGVRGLNKDLLALVERNLKLIDV